MNNSEVDFVDDVAVNLHPANAQQAADTAKEMTAGQAEALFGSDRGRDFCLGTRESLASNFYDDTPLGKLRPVYWQGREQATCSDAAILTRRDQTLLQAMFTLPHHNFGSLMSDILTANSSYPLLRQLMRRVFKLGPCNLMLALASSLATASAVVGPSLRIRDRQYLVSPNLLVAAPACSGSGKNAALGLPAVLLSALGRQGELQENFSSPQALEDALKSTGTVCATLDEFASPGRGSKASLLGQILDVSTRTQRGLVGRRLSGQPSVPVSQAKQVFFTALMGGTPGNMLSQFGGEILSSGLASRLTILPGAVLRSEVELKRLLDETEAEDGGPLEDHALASALLGRMGAPTPGLPSSEPEQLVEGGERVLTLGLEDTQEVAETLERNRGLHSLARGQISNPLFARMRENTLKVAGLLQRMRCGLSDPECLLISDADLDLACRIVGYSAVALGWGIKAAGVDSQILETANELHLWLSRRPDASCLASDFAHIKRRAKYRREAEQLLEEQGRIKYRTSHRGGGRHVLACEPPDA